MPVTDLSRLRIRRDERPRRHWLLWSLIGAGVALAIGAYPYAGAYLAARRAPEVDVARTIRIDNVSVLSSIVPGFLVSGRNLATAIGLAALIGLVAGAIPATMAARLKVVYALRRVA